MTIKQQREWYLRDREIILDRLGITKLTFNAFRNIGRALRQEYENQCNGFETTAQEEESERAEESLTNQAFDLAKQYGLEIFLQTDPRGATIYLSKEPIEENNYNRPGVECIY